MSETLALSAIENIAKYLPRAVKDGNDLEAREHVAYGSTICRDDDAAYVHHGRSTLMEHAMSAYHHELPHGAGLIMISKAFAEFFIEKHACDEQLYQNGKSDGDPGCRQAGGFHYRAGEAAAGLRRGRPENERLRHRPVEECMTLAVNATRDDGRPVFGQSVRDDGCRLRGRI